MYFKYGDRVEILEGFWRGLQGQLISFGWDKDLEQWVYTVKLDTSHILVPMEEDYLWDLKDGPVPTPQEEGNSEP